MNALFADTPRRPRAENGLSQRGLAKRMFAARTNVVFLTTYVGHSLDAWGIGASGFMVKPITQEGARGQLERLRYPFSMGGASG